MQNKLHHKFHTKLISYDQFMEYKLYDKAQLNYQNAMSMKNTNYMKLMKDIIPKKIKNYGELLI